MGHPTVILTALTMLLVFVLIAGWLTGAGHGAFIISRSDG